MGFYIPRDGSIGKALSTSILRKHSPYDTWLEKYSHVNDRSLHPIACDKAGTPNCTRVRTLRFFIPGGICSALVEADVITWMVIQ